MDRLYFRQLLAGRDFGIDHPMAGGMRNFVYLIGDRETRECVAVDPAWAIDDILAIVARDGMKLTGCLATHYHPDHVGGDLMGMCQVEGVDELLEREAIKVFCQADEAPWMKRVTRVSDSDLSLCSSGDVIDVGQVPITVIHTPGHTPGSQCFLVDNRLVAGDTLFLDGCGRTDLPGGDPEELYRSLHQRLAHLGDDTILFPGHDYSNGKESADMGDVRRSNYVFTRMKSLDDWKRLM